MTVFKAIKTMSEKEMAMFLLLLAKEPKFDGVDLTKESLASNFDDIREWLNSKWHNSELCEPCDFYR